MTAGTSSYMGMAIGNDGEGTITQATAATDILTIKGTTSQTGKFMNFVNVSDSSKASIDCNGAIATGCFIATHDWGTAGSPATTTLTVDGGIAVGGSSDGFAAIYVRVNGVIYRATAKAV